MSRILLADDDVELSEMLTQYLAAEGFTVEAVSDGETALTKAKAGKYDLVILDVMMPRMNGLKEFFNFAQEQTFAKGRI